ncbi:uncharacterized protein METZ01_LOCUS444531 [marine metagenome]|uniref:Uncharacterized protein n=1 Tax=marine metagenome TaxID=408172 RepID=A0A382Z840_9ZZZZ
MTEVQVQGVAMSNDGLQAHYVASDPRASYTLINSKVELQKYNPAFTEWVSPHKVDLNLMPPDGLQQHYEKSVVKTQGLPMSFLQVQSVEEGTEWYKMNTRYPDEVCEMLAQYEWGDLRYTTKKEFKNLKKKTHRKKMKQKHMTVRRPNDPILLHFD